MGDVDALKQELEALKAIMAKREMEAVEAAENTEALQKEFKKNCLKAKKIHRLEWGIE